MIYIILFIFVVFCVSVLFSFKIYKHITTKPVYRRKNKTVKKDALSIINYASRKKIQVFFVEKRFDRYDVKHLSFRKKEKVQILRSFTHKEFKEYIDSWKNCAYKTENNRFFVFQKNFLPRNVEELTFCVEEGVRKPVIMILRNTPRGKTLKK